MQGSQVGREMSRASGNDCGRCVGWGAVRKPVANVAGGSLLFTGSGFLSQRELYRLGGLTTAFNMLLYLVVGTSWVRLIGWKFT